MGGGKTQATLKRKLKRNRTLSVGFHEIIAVTKMGERARQRENQNHFPLGPKKRKTEQERRKKDLSDRYIRTITNVPLCRVN